MIHTGTESESVLVVKLSDVFLHVFYMFLGDCGGYCRVGHSLAPNPRQCSLINQSTDQSIVVQHSLFHVNFQTIALKKKS
jgi:hypothetical protein